MKMTRFYREVLSYAGATENAPIALADRPSPGASSKRSSRRPSNYAACRDIAGEWVPRVEASQVPSTLAAACASCPIREQCLQMALDEQMRGYWGGTTTLQRRQMRAAGLDAAGAPPREAEPARHPVGNGSEWHYRQGCRCEECREVHTHVRRAERARRRSARLSIEGAL